MANWEQGRQRPTIAAAKKIADTFGLTLDYLLAGNGELQRTAFEPRNPDFDARVRDSFAGQAFMTTAGASIERVAPGEVLIALPFDQRLGQQHGFLHGGVTSAVLDTACGLAGLSLMPADAGVLTVEFKVSLLAPGRGKAFRFAGRVVKPGRTLMFCEGIAHAVGPDGEKPIATLSATMMAVNGRDDVKG